MAAFEKDKEESPAARFHRDGFLVIDDVIDVDVVDKLYNKSMSNFNELEAILLSQKEYPQLAEIILMENTFNLFTRNLGNYQ